MSRMSRVAAAALLCVGAAAQAQFLPPPSPPSPVQPTQTTLNFTASATDAGANLSQVAGGDFQVITGPANSGGLRTAQAGAATASVFADADPVRGMLKSLATARVDGSASADFASATASMRMEDTLRFSGADTSTRVSFTLYWDTVLSGMNEGLVAPDNGAYWYQQATSSTVVGLSWRTPNLAWTPDALCEPGSEWCEPAFVTQTVEDGFALVSLAGSNGFGDSYFSGQRNGRHTNEMTVSVELPVEVDIRVVYLVQTEASCFQMLNCAVTVDASHSNYLGLATAPGVDFRSSNGFQYLGRDGLAAAVPEPASWALMLLGAGALLLRRGRGR